MKLNESESIAVLFLALVGALASVDWTQAQIRGALAKRKHRKAWKKAIARWDARTKGEVLDIKPLGESVALPEGYVGPVITFGVDGWLILIGLGTNVPPTWHGPTGEPVFGGYTADELAEIAKRPGEFSRVSE